MPRPPMLSAALSLLPPAAAASPAGGPLTERAMCRSADAVLIVQAEAGGAIEERELGAGTLPLTLQPMTVERRIHVDPRSPAANIEDTLVLLIPGDWRDQGASTQGTFSIVGAPNWAPGTRHLLVLRWFPGDEELPPTWLRIVDKPEPRYGLAPLLSDLQHSFARHCAAHRDDLPPTPPSWRAAWVDDRFAGFAGCTHEGDE